MKKTYKEVLLDPGISFNTILESQAMPKHLYKYQSFYSENLKENKHWRANIAGAFHLSLGNEFEDQNDCKPYFNKDEVCKIFEHFLRDCPPKNLTDEKIHALCSTLYSELKQEYFEGVMSNYQREIRIGCFTISSDNAIMWEKYANDETGFCIEYDTSKNLLFKHTTLPVLYSNQPYNSSLSVATQIILEGVRSGKERSQEEHLELYKEIYEKNLKTVYVPVFIKEKEKWDFEQEYRMFLLKNRTTTVGMLRAKDILDANSNIDLSNAITAIYLGERFNMNLNHNAIKEEILRSVKNTSIKVFQKKRIGRTYINEIIQ